MRVLYELDAPANLGIYATTYHTIALLSLYESWQAHKIEFILCKHHTCFFGENCLHSRRAVTIHDI
jgi:hypothetical protein